MKDPPPRLCSRMLLPGTIIAVLISEPYWYRPYRGPMARAQRPRQGEEALPLL